MSYGYIYLIKDHFTNKVYVGQRRGEPNKSKNYFGSGQLIKLVVKKRRHLLEKRILGICNSAEELDNAEIECISFYNSTNDLYGYNISEGGNVNRAMRGSKHPLFNKHHTKSAKLKIGKAASIRNSGKGNPAFGKIWIFNKELFQQKRIFKEELENYKQYGWIAGTKPHSEKSKVQLSKKCVGKNNPMYGKSVYETWIKKYGKIIADQKKKELYSKRKHQ